MLVPCNIILWVCWLVSGYNYPPLVLILLTRLHHDYTQVTVKCAAACLLSVYCPPTILIYIRPKIFYITEKYFQPVHGVRVRGAGGEQRGPGAEERARDGHYRRDK